MINEKFYRKVLEQLGVTDEQLHSPRHRRNLVDARYLMAAALMRLPQMRQADVAEILNTRQGDVSYMLHRHEVLKEVDKGYRAKWEKIVSLLDE